MHGVHTAENSCAGVDLSDAAGCTEVCTEGCTEPEWHQKARLWRQENPAMAPSSLALKLQNELGVMVSGRQVKKVLEQEAA